MSMIIQTSIKDSVSPGILIFSLVLSLILTIHRISGIDKILTPEIVADNIIIIAFYAGLIAIILYAIPVYSFLIRLTFLLIEKYKTGKGSVTYYEIFNTDFFNELRTKIETFVFAIFSTLTVFCYIQLLNPIFLSGKNLILGFITQISLFVILIFLVIRLYFLLKGNVKFNLVSNLDLLYDVRQYYITRESNRLKTKIEYPPYYQFIDSVLPQLDTYFSRNMKAFREILIERYLLISKHIELRMKRDLEFKKIFADFNKGQIKDFRDFGGHLLNYQRELINIDYSSMRHFSVQSMGKEYKNYLINLEECVKHFESLSQQVILLHKYSFTTTGYERRDFPEKANKIIKAILTQVLSDKREIEIVEDVIRKNGSTMLNVADIKVCFRKVTGKSLGDDIEDIYHFFIKWTTSIITEMNKKKEECIKILEDNSIKAKNIISTENSKKYAKIS